MIGKWVKVVISCVVLVMVVSGCVPHYTPEDFIDDIGGLQMPLVKIKDSTDIIGHGEWRGLTGGSLTIGGIIFAYLDTRTGEVIFISTDIERVVIVYHDSPDAYVGFTLVDERKSCNHRDRYVRWVAEGGRKSKLIKTCVVTFTFYVARGEENDFIAGW